MLASAFIHFKKNCSFVLESYDVFIVDLWGVIHDGHTLLRGVLSFLMMLKDHHKQVIFLSNSPKRAYDLEDHLTHLGITRDMYAFVYSSGEKAYEALQSYQPTVIYPIMAPSHQGLVYDLDLTVTEDITKATLILATDFKNVPSDDWLFLERKIPMICINPDKHVWVGGKLKPCAGSLAALYEEKGGTVIYYGKPYACVYESVLERLNIKNKKKILCVGDSLDTDILGAKNMDLDSLLVLSGLETNGNFGDDMLLSPKLLKRMKDKDIYPTFVAPGFY